VAFKSNGDDLLALHRCCFSLWNAIPSQVNCVIPGEYQNNSIRCVVVVFMQRDSCVFSLLDVLEASSFI
jgi:hypothetical protein